MRFETKKKKKEKNPFSSENKAPLHDKPFLKQVFSLSEISEKTLPRHPWVSRLCVRLSLCQPRSVVMCRLAFSRKYSQLFFGTTESLLFRQQQRSVGSPHCTPQKAVRAAITRICVQLTSTPLALVMWVRALTHPVTSLLSGLQVKKK